MSTNGKKQKQAVDKVVNEIVDIVPEVKDPFWPSGAAPMHLSKAAQQTAEIIEAYAPDWKCMRCGSTSHKDKRNSSLCVTCAKAEAQNSSLAIKTNSNWMELAAELGIALFERQPEETDTEWKIWCAYRGYYPLKLPTMAELAATVGCSVSTVVKASQRWSYKVRLIEWARFTDADIQEKRIEAVREMNMKQLTMSQRIQNKLEEAIEYIDPATLKPNELVNLFKMATELERKITEYVEERVESTAVESSTKHQELTKPEDMNEVLSILQKAGVLDGKTIGVEQTTRFVVKEDDK